MIETGLVLKTRYELYRSIGENTFGDNIWLAKDRILDREVAVKIYQPRLTDPTIDEIEINEINEARKRSFLNDAKKSAKFVHPNMLPIYDVGDEEELIFIVTALAHKMTMLEFISESIEIRLEEKLRILQQVASAIDYIHTNGIIHRDIKPSIILFDENFHVYISDLSIAMSKLELDSPAAGTLMYMSPEALISDPELPIDFSTDIFAFGIIAFQFICGKHPFNLEATSPPHTLVTRILREDIPSIRQFLPELPISLDLVLRRLTDKDPKQRYPSASVAMDDMYRAFYSGQSSIKGRIFISYATKDKAYVHQLTKELRRLNIDLWIDQDIEKGSDWGDSIEKALKETDIMLLILSEDSVVSEYVIHEWSFFMGLDKPIYPLILYSSPPKEVHSRLQRLQHIMGTGDMFTDISRIIDVLAGGNPSRIQAET